MRGKKAKKRRQESDLRGAHSSAALRRATLYGQSDLTPVAWELRYHELQWRQAQIDLLCVVLVHQRDARPHIALHLADRGLELAEHELQQSGLARPIRAHKRDAGVAVEAEVHTVVKVVLRLAGVPTPSNLAIC